MSALRPGTVYLVGAGPGDPGLLTLRAAELIGRADTLVHDRLVHPDVLRRAKSGARLVLVGKEGGGEQVSQEEIESILIDQARLGREVVRLKGGDPFVFGRGGEEAISLRNAGIAFEVVPGVSSGVAAPALAGIPLTHRGISASATFATAQLAGCVPDWEHLARAPTLVLFMGGRRLETATLELIRFGRAPTTPAAVIVAASWEHQRVVQGTLADIAARAREAGIGSPALLVVGEVVALRQVIGEIVPTAARPRSSASGSAQ